MIMGSYFCCAFMVFVHRTESFFKLVCIQVWPKPTFSMPLVLCLKIELNFSLLEFPVITMIYFKLTSLQYHSKGIEWCHSLWHQLGYKRKFRLLLNCRQLDPCCSLLWWLHRFRTLITIELSWNSECLKSNVQKLWRSHTKRRKEHRLFLLPFELCHWDWFQSRVALVTSFLSVGTDIDYDLIKLPDLSCRESDWSTGILSSFKNDLVLVH